MQWQNWERDMIVVKIGGSVAEIAGKIFSELYETGESILVIPGGWIFAEKIRKMDVDDDSAHWMAIEAMNMYGYYLSKYADLVEPYDFDFQLRGVKILLPYTLLKRYDELPHSWDVTSDSIAVWIAEKINAEKIIKVTDVDGIVVDGGVVERIRAGDINFETCIDRFAPLLLERYGREMFICNGYGRGRVKDYIMKGIAFGTTVIGR